MNLPDYVENDNVESDFSKSAIEIMKRKYLRRNNKRKIVESPKERIYTVAREIAQAEEKYNNNVDEYTKIFYEMIRNKEFSPAGRIWANAGTSIKQLFNCFVVPVPDDLDGIFQALKEAALIHKQGGGTGFNFSKLRPRGSIVKGANGIASGPVSFIQNFDQETEIISQANRRGANMGILNVDHPDILEFIYSKTEEGELNNFNISVGVTDEFMESALDGGYYKLKNPMTGDYLKKEELEQLQYNIETNKAGTTPGPPYLVISDGEVIDTHRDRVIGRIKNGYVELNSKKILDTIAELAWKTADPGIIFLDRLNNGNPLFPEEKIEATNPCGEQPLLPYEACNLGSINLSKMIKEENGESKIDFDLLKETTRKGVRFLDDVNDVNKGPLPKIEKNVNKNRRIGLGVMGFHDMLLKLKIPYDSDEAFEIAEKVMKFIKEESIKMSKELAEERGPFPNYEKSSLKEPRRNMSIRTIAPTGSISMVFDVNSGIEPYYSLVYNKNTLSGDSFTYVNPYFKEIAKEKGFYSEELMEKIKENRGSVQDIAEIPEAVKRLFKCSLDIDYKDHVKMQAVFQKYVDNSISKTINLENDASIQDVKEAYSLAYETGCKGITIYRDGSKSFQILESSKEESEEELKKPRKRPNIIHGTTQRIETGQGSMYVTINEDETGLFEVFASIGKSGGFTSSFTEALGRLVSLALRSGIDPEEVIEELEGIRSPKMAWDKGSKIHSIPDGIGKALKRYMKGEAREIQESVESFSEKEETQNKKDQIKEMVEKGINPECPECGAMLEYSEGCVKCSSCGYSEC